MLMVVHAHPKVHLDSFSISRSGRVVGVEIHDHGHNYVWYVRFSVRNGRIIGTERDAGYKIIWKGYSGRKHLADYNPGILSLFIQVLRELVDYMDGGFKSAFAYELVV